MFEIAIRQVGRSTRLQNYIPVGKEGVVWVAILKSRMEEEEEWQQSVGGVMHLAVRHPIPSCGDVSV